MRDEIVDLVELKPSPARSSASRSNAGEASIATLWITRASVCIVVPGPIFAGNATHRRLCSDNVTLAAKPASVDLRARPLARAKAALPSVQKARRRLAA